MKYMLMMFGDGGEMLKERDRDWVLAMHAFMGEFNEELAENGEVITGEGLAFPSTAKTVSLVDGQVVVTDGPYAEAKESLAGYWILDVADEARAIELGAKVAFWSQSIELRAIPDGPPEV